MTASTNDRVEIDFSIYNPFDPGFIRDPYPVIRRLLADYPVAFHRDVNAWMVSGHDLAAEVFKHPKLSTRFADWSNAPEPRPREEWILYDEVQQHTLGNSTPDDHLRLRQLTAPAFSRRVMDQIEERVRDAVVGVFDEITDPRHRRDGRRRGRRP